MAVKKTNSANFETDVLKNEKPVMIDFWAEWCGPCRALTLVLDDVSAELGDSVEIFKINVDENPDLAQKYGVRGIPTMIAFKGGVAYKTLVGMHSKDVIKKMITED